MRLFLSSFCLLVLLWNNGASIAAPRSHEQVSPQEAKKILTLNVLGANMTMSMGQIKDLLTEQGYKVNCTRSDCTVREGRIMYSFGYYQKRYDRTPLDEKRSPTAITHTLNGAEPKDCGDMQKAIETFCTNGIDKFPCINSNALIKADVRPGVASDDGWIYSMSVKIDPPIQCMIKIERQNIRHKN